MSFERSVSDSILRKRLTEASFTIGDTTYSSAFGRYYKNGEKITREDYFDAKEKAVEAPSTANVTKPKVVAPTTDKLTKGTSKKYKDGTLTTFSADATLDTFVDSIPQEYKLIKSKGNAERGSLIFSDDAGNTIWINKDGENSKLWIYNEPKHAKKSNPDTTPAEKSEEPTRKPTVGKVDYKKSTDDDLLTLHKSGDKQATNSLLARYEGLVRYIAKSYYAPGADIDDLTQEGILGVYDAMDSYKVGKNKNFKQFAVLAAKRNILNFIDKQNTKKNSPLTSYSTYDDVQKASDVGNPELEYSKKANQEMVNDFLKKNLTDTEQKVLALYLQKYKTREIMDELGISNKAVENAMMRVRKKVRAWQDAKNESTNVGTILESDLDTIDKSPKSMYDKYLEKHRRMILEIYESIMRPALVNDGYPEHVLNTINENLVAHDESKYREDEWEAYQNHFYSPDKNPRNTEAFNTAWNHHQCRNPHHWQYWVLINDVDEPQFQPIDMPLVYIVEMLCDWHAAGKHYGNSAKEWYTKQKDKMILSENTRFMVENYINLLG